VWLFPLFRSPTPYHFPALELRVISVCFALSGPVRLTTSHAFPQSILFLVTTPEHFLLLPLTFLLLCCPSPSHAPFFWKSRHVIGRWTPCFFSPRWSFWTPFVPVDGRLGHFIPFGPCTPQTVSCPSPPFGPVLWNIGSDRLGCQFGLFPIANLFFPPVRLSAFGSRPARCTSLCSASVST